jgi:hypothetical protein
MVGQSDWLPMTMATAGLVLMELSLTLHKRGN